MTVEPSCFPGWLVLGCAKCGPIKLLPRSGPRLGGQPRLRKADQNRALRAARRQKLRSA